MCATEAERVLATGDFNCLSGKGLMALLTDPSVVEREAVGPSPDRGFGDREVLTPGPTPSRMG